MLTLIVVTALVVLGVAAYAWVRAHPKPADEALNTYVEEVVEGLPAESEVEVEQAVEEVKAVVKRVRAKKATPAATTTPTTTPTITATTTPTA